MWTAPGSIDPPGLTRAWRAGRRGLATFSGPWAAVLWHPSEQSYSIAADPIGVMPVFWARTSSGTIAVSTWLEALVEHAHLDTTVDVEAALLIAGAGLQDAANAHRTPFAAVSQVPGGCVLQVRPDGRPMLSRYWDASCLPAPDETLSLPDCAALLREGIDAALRRLLPADEGIGAHVSGGLDSSAIACRAQVLLAESGRRLAAGYSWTPTDALHPRQPGDENAVLDDVARWAGVPIRRREGVGYAPWFAAADPALYPEATHLMESWLLPVARADGVGVMLSGWGGDELASYNGFGVVETLVRRGALGWARREVVDRRAVLGEPAPSNAATARALAGAAYRTLPPAIRAARHPFRQLAGRRAEAELEEQLRAVSPLAAQLRREGLGQLSQPDDHHARQLALIQRGHLQHRATWWHQTGQLFGIQYRYPLLDLEVVSAVARLPWWAFRYRGWDRPAFRLAVSPWVPESVAWSVHKSEPAIFDPAALAWLNANVEPRRRPVPDAAYDRAMRVAWRTWDDIGAAAPEGPPEPVVCRPELAGRLTEPSDAPWLRRQGHGVRRRLGSRG